MVLGLMISEVLNLSFFLFSFYVLVIWVRVLGLLSLYSCDGFEFYVAGFDLGRI